MSKIKHTISSGNVYEDLGINNSAEMKMKAKAVHILATTIAASGKTQSEIANTLGIDQPKISRILRGQFRGLSLEKILGYILALGNDIDINVRKQQSEEPAIHVHIATVG